MSIRKLMIACTAAVLLTSALGAQTGASAMRSVAVTIDDLQAYEGGNRVAGLTSQTTHLISALKAHQAPAIGFVCESWLMFGGQQDQLADIMKGWVDAGFTLGNHTYNHLDFDKTPLDKYQENVLKGDTVTRWLLQAKGQEPHWFRHPFNHTGATKELKEAFEKFLAENHYRLAPFTIEVADYLYASQYATATAKKNTELAQRLKAAYLDHIDRAFTFFEGLAREVFGREIPQILLIHANQLNAECLGDVLDKISARGYRFVTLDEATADDAYRTPDTYVGPNGYSWLHRYSLSKGMPLRIKDEPDPPAWVLNTEKKKQ